MRKSARVITEKLGTETGIKARLVVHGNQEKFPARTDSPMVKKSSMRMQLALAAQNKWKVRTADVTAAFLQSNMLSRDVFVKPVKEADAQGKLWRLLKPMYGLGDSSRQWYLTIAENLKQLGCKRLDTDHAVFYFKEHGRLKGIITMHVDDLCISGNAEFDERVMKPILNIFKFGSITEDERFALLGWNS